AAAPKRSTTPRRDTPSAQPPPTTGTPNRDVTPPAIVLEEHLDVAASTARHGIAGTSSSIAFEQTKNLAERLKVLRHQRREIPGCPIGAHTFGMRLTSRMSGALSTFRFRHFIFPASAPSGC